MTVSKLAGRFDLRDWGTLGAGNDAAILQQCCDDLFGPVSPVPTGRPGLSTATLHIPQLVELDQTISLRQSAPVFTGNGAYGNEYGAFPVSAGPRHNGSVIRWAGAAGVPMFHYVDCREVRWESVRFQGLNGSEPSAAHHFENEPGVLDAIGANIGKTFRNCHFGQWVWSTGGLNDGTMENAILVDGENANNDRLRVFESTFRGCTTGIRVSNGQSVWGDYQNIEFHSCGLGLHSAASFHARNLQVQSCDRGLLIENFSSAWIEGLNMERTAELAKLTGGSRLLVRGGYSQIPAIAGGTVPSLNGHFIDATDCTSETEIVFEGHAFTDPFSQAPLAPITMTPTSGASLTGQPPKLRLDDNPTFGNVTVAELYAGAINLVDNSDHRVIEGTDDSGRKFRVHLNRERNNAAEAFDPESWEIGERLIVRSPNGNRWAVTIDNAGNLQTAAI